MPSRPNHSWDVTPARAAQLQTSLRRHLVLENRLGKITRVAGVDVGFEQNNTVTRAAVAVLSFPDLEPLEKAIARLPTSFPYVPGLLSFRELPAVLAALSQLRQAPELILCDGQGYAHPRRFGLACHLGVLTDIPTIGVAKSRLIGTYREPAQRRGAWSALREGKETIGSVLRTRMGTKPLFVSCGHRVDLPAARRHVLNCSPLFRLPETTRAAHRLASGPL